MTAIEQCTVAPEAVWLAWQLPHQSGMWCGNNMLSPHQIFGSVTAKILGNSLPRIRPSIDISFYIILRDFKHFMIITESTSLVYDLEKVQKRATKMVQGCNKKSYKDRLKMLKLPTLLYRRLRGDMIEVYKIIHCHYDSSVAPPLERNMDSRTRGNPLKLKVERCKYDLRKYSFCNRVVSVWNSLPDTVVCACSLDSFKNNLDKHWKKEEVLYNYDAVLSTSIC